MSIFEVYHGRFFLDQVVQSITGAIAPVRFPGWTMNPTELVVAPEQLTAQQEYAYVRMDSEGVYRIVSTSTQFVRIC